MNEEQKNIETCLAENILSEVANVPTDPQFRSLTDEALDPLKQQALQQAGYDGYEKVVWTHKPYTFSSQVKQMKSNLILLLRRLWRYPFGRGNNASSEASPIRSLADMWQHYITRLKGNSEYGIPSRLSQLTDLPSAPALLADRKISGAIGAPDGISLAQLICSTSAASSVTEIVDTNVGWTMTKELPFEHLNKLVLGCGYVALGLKIINNQDVEDVVLPHCKGMAERGDNFGSLTLISGSPNVKRIYAPKLVHTGGYQYLFIVNDLQYLEELNLPSYEEFWTTFGYGIANNCQSLKRIIMPKYKYYNVYSGLFKNLPALEYVYLPSITDLSHNYFGYSVSNCPELHTLVLGVMTGSNAASLTDCPKLVHLEFASVVGSINISGWNPTTALSDNLQQFLQNFRDYIALRLIDKGTGLTITLSQEVRNAIHAAEDEYGIENIIITKKGWTISPAPN